MQQGKVVRIFIATEDGEPMIAIPSVRALSGLGLEGDRYAKGVGAHSASKRVTQRHVTFISLEAIRDANAELNEAFEPNETRRNILTSGINLAQLVGKEFTVGNVKMRGVEICEPCARPSKLANKPRFINAFRGHRGGIRAEILNTGTINVDDAISAS